MENQIIQEGIIYSLEINSDGEKIAIVAGHTEYLVGTIERITPSSYHFMEGPYYVMFEHNGSEYGPIEMPMPSQFEVSIVKEGLLEIAIPETIGDGYKVIGIGDSALQGCYRIQSLKLPETIRFVAKYAFSGCYNLGHIDFRSEVHVDAKSNLGNTSLHYITIHDESSLRSAYGLLNGLEFERAENLAVNVKYPDTAISEIIIAKDATISEEDKYLQFVSKQFKVSKQD